MAILTMHDTGTKFSNSSTGTKFRSSTRSSKLRDHMDLASGTDKCVHPVHIGPCEDSETHPKGVLDDDIYQKQFLVAGSIGDRRVRILVDTGATIRSNNRL